jgi:hypothetical protein
VDEARLDLFACKQRAYDSIPPTRATLKEPAKRATYQARIIWGEAIVIDPEVSSLANWEWTQSGESLQIYWSTPPHIGTSCQEHTKCPYVIGCNPVLLHRIILNGIVQMCK